MLKNLVTIIIAILIASLIRLFFIQIYVIPSESMTPTIQIEDRVLVVKDDFIDIEYKVGDIVVFYNPNNYSEITYIEKFLDAINTNIFMQSDTAVKAAYIKRIVGLPGDDINIDNFGNVYRNNQLVIFDGILNETFSSKNNFIIPNNSYFVMGDNRKNSEDSRIFGYVPKSNIIGKAYFKVYPFDDISAFND
ncbi:signal peptidase I [Candidatus Actinomarina]|nr:signal peptidase I [Candidatus Actinomarina sp.]